MDKFNTTKLEKMERVNELDFSKEEKLFFERRGELLKKNFGKRFVEVTLLQDESELKDYIIKFVCERSYIKEIAFSDGVTLYQLGLFDWVRETFKDKKINQPLERAENGHYKVFEDQPMGRMNLPYEEWKRRQTIWSEGVRASMLSDLFIISANAITLDGEIVSIDGMGNRVAGMIYGPRHVLCIVGRNKIATNVETALDRIHNYVAPMTFIRHMFKHDGSFQDNPCVKIGKCFHCSSEYCACRDVVIKRGQNKSQKDRLHLVVINKDLGF